MSKDATHSKPAKTDTVRMVALKVVAQVQTGALLSDTFPEMRALQPDERARAQRLAASTCRWADRADRMLGPYLRLRPTDAVLNILRLGVIEMAVHAAPPHGVINAMVQIARALSATSKAPGLVNAVLRRVSEGLDKWDSLPMPRLPKPLRKRLIATYGKQATEAMEAAHARAAPLDVTLRDAAAGNPFGDAAQPLPTGSLRLHKPGQVSALPGFQEGQWWVQDAAAALPARVLAVQPKERVLDICAAPGGKTMQLAAAGAQVTAIDLSAKRMAQVTENLARTGLCAQTIVADALTYWGDPSGPSDPSGQSDPSDAQGMLYDAVLLDAPCSATGTIRRHPDLPIAKAGQDFAELVALQAKMLDQAQARTAPGGRLVYCTCSLLPEEGEAQIAAALARHPQLSVDTAALALAGIDADWIGPFGMRLRPDYWPQAGGMDGFFISLLRKSAEAAILQ